MAVELTVKLPNRAGQLGALAGALGEAGVNMRSIAATTGGGQGIIHIVVDDKDAGKARRALKRGKFRIASDRKRVEVRLADKPGTLGRAAQRLGKQEAKLEPPHMVGQSTSSRRHRDR